MNEENKSRKRYSQRKKNKNKSTHSNNSVSKQITQKEKRDNEIKKELEETLTHIELEYTKSHPKVNEDVHDPDNTFIAYTPLVEDVAPKKKKNKLTKKGIIIIIAIIALIDLLFIIFVISTSNKNKDKVDNKEEVVEKKTDDDVKKKDEVEKPKEKEERDNYDLTKLEKLDNIDTKIDFFNYNYIDRYISVKEKNPKIELEMVIVYVNIGLDKKFYTDIKPSPNQDTNTVLTNKYYSLASNYEPKDLVAISSNYSSGTRKMTKDAKEAFESLAKAAKSEGYNIRATSTYRSYSYQKDLYNRYAASDGQAKADTYSARPGHSEHQTGLAVDVDNNKSSYTSFGSTKEFNWMKQNAYKYGFILRYTKDNEWITGYKDEPWHYRYVGVEIATYIQEHPMTYEEYFVRFIENKNKS